MSWALKLVLFFFASPKKKSTKRKKATFGEMLRTPKGARRWYCSNS